jgi:hypothetical protein
MSPAIRLLSPVETTILPDDDDNEDPVIIDTPACSIEDDKVDDVDIVVLDALVIDISPPDVRESPDAIDIDPA